MTTDSPRPNPLATEVERQARRLGVPLATVELLLAHPKLARDFLRAVRADRVRQFLDGLDDAALERALAAHEHRTKGSSPVGVFHG